MFIFTPEQHQQAYATLRTKDINLLAMSFGAQFRENPEVGEDFDAAGLLSLTLEQFSDLISNMPDTGLSYSIIRTLYPPSEERATQTYEAKIPWKISLKQPKK